jgi:hypothetical protein
VATTIWRRGMPFWSIAATICRVPAGPATGLNFRLPV